MGSNRFDAMNELIWEMLAESGNYIADKTLEEINDLLDKCDKPLDTNEHDLCFKKMLQILKEIVGRA